MRVMTREKSVWSRSGESSLVGVRDALRRMTDEGCTGSGRCQTLTKKQNKTVESSTFAEMMNCANFVTLLCFKKGRGALQTCIVRLVYHITVALLEFKYGFISKIAF